MYQSEKAVIPPGLVFNATATATIALFIDILDSFVNPDVRK